MRNSNKTFNILELYAGTGRSVEPFRNWSRTGSITLVDINSYAADVYKKNFPAAAYHVHDLGKTDTNELLRLAGGRVDVLLGCPPCQGFSDCGSKNPNDSRNRHVSKFHAIVRDLKPKVMAMENVPLVAASGRFKQFTVGLEALGYNWTAAIVNAALYGSCQSRQRMILVAAKKDLKIVPAFPEPTHGGTGLYFDYSRHKFSKISDDPVGMLGRAPGAQRAEKNVPHKMGLKTGEKAAPTVDDVIGDLGTVDSEKATKLGHKSWDHTTAVLKRMGNVGEGKRWRGGSDHYSQTYGRLHRKGLARTITGYFSNAGSGRFWHPTENRSLSLREAARIQGFPDDFAFGKFNFENCILVGNALDKALAKLTHRIITACLEN
jgi:DNA (cytosine-5)-methyltransferase 1